MRPGHVAKLEHAEQGPSTSTTPQSGSSPRCDFRKARHPSPRVDPSTPLLNRSITRCLPGLHLGISHLHSRPSFLIDILEAEIEVHPHFLETVRGGQANNYSLPQQIGTLGRIGPPFCCSRSGYAVQSWFTEFGAVASEAVSIISGTHTISEQSAVSAPRKGTSGMESLLHDHTAIVTTGNSSVQRAVAYQGNYHLSRAV